MRQKLFLIIAIYILHFSSNAQSIYINTVIHHSDCHSACDGSVAVAGNGGFAPYTYTWMPSGVNTSTLNNLCPGTYTVHVEDANLNLASIEVVILEQPSYFLPYIGINPTCFGSCTGALNLIAGASGGTPPYTYKLNNFQVVPGVIGNLCEGNYTVQVTDATNCKSNLPTSIYAIGEDTTNIRRISTTCGACNGVAWTPFAASSYSWSPGGSTNDTISNLCAGNYTLNMTDLSGCLFTRTVTIPIAGSSGAIPNFSATTTSYNESCNQSGDGAIDLNISGTNTGPFTYLWSNGAITQDITNISSDIYSVSIIDGSSNCIVLKDTISSIGINCGTISGNVFIDHDLNCYRNPNDTAFYGATIMVNPGNRIGYSNTQGNYIVNNLPTGNTYTITTQTNNWYYSPSCNTSRQVSLSFISNQSNINLPVIANTVFDSLPEMSIWLNIFNFSPGFISTVNYSLYNYRNLNGNGTCKAILPSFAITNIVNVSPSTYTISLDTIMWNFSNITYSGGGKLFQVKFTVPVNTPLGTTFTTCAWAQPTITDINYTNNYDCAGVFATGSFDPNDKTVNPAGIGANGDIAATETELTYVIRFQNTGNGPAVNITVKDTLSPNVDVNTFEMLSASHNYNIDILPGNVLRWKFNNIMLADSGSNEPASHGYIQYRIKRTNNNTPGSQIKNTAYIYFDFNEPVMTNTAINTIVTLAGIKDENVSENGWNIYPNPSTGLLYIVNSTNLKEKNQIQILNSIGQTVFEETITSNYKNIDLSKLTNGVYFVKISSDKSSTVKRLVLSK